MLKFSLDLPSYKIETLKRRKSLLLDSSVWIRLADGKTAESVEVRDKLLRLNAQELIVCPLTAPTIWELRKQSGASLYRTAELMEELSLNISFRGLDYLFDREIAHFLEYMLTDQFTPLAASEKFGSLLSYLYPTFSIIPGPDPQEPEAQKLYEHLSELVRDMSLTELIKILGTASFPGLKSPPKYQVTNIKRRETAKKAAKPKCVA
jgi:hypothetical protein